MVINETVITTVTDYAISDATTPIRDKIITLLVTTSKKVIGAIIAFFGMKFFPLPHARIVLGAIFGILAILSVISFIELIGVIVSSMIQ